MNGPGYPWRPGGFRPHPPFFGLQIALPTRRVIAVIVLLSVKGKKMSARVCKLCAVLIAASLLLASCSLVKQRRRLGQRRDAPPAANSEMQDLKRENAVLRENNKLALERMEALAKQMEAERAEQRRFRDMMATNFELLEQSVSLSLAKTAGESPIVQPDKMNLPPPPLERK